MSVHIGDEFAVRHCDHTAGVGQEQLVDPEIMHIDQWSLAVQMTNGTCKAASNVDKKETRADMAA